MDICPADDDGRALTQGHKAGCAPPTEAEDQVAPSSTDLEPASESRDLESPVTQQPEPQPVEAPPSTTEKVRPAL